MYVETSAINKSKTMFTDWKNGPEDNSLEDIGWSRSPWDWNETKKHNSKCLDLGKIRDNEDWGGWETPVVTHEKPLVLNEPFHLDINKKSRVTMKWHGSRKSTYKLMDKLYCCPNYQYDQQIKRGWDDLMTRRHDGNSPTSMRRQGQRQT